MSGEVPRSSRRDAVVNDDGMWVISDNTEILDAYIVYSLLHRGASTACRFVLSIVSDRTFELLLPNTKNVVANILPLSMHVWYAMEQRVEQRSFAETITPFKRKTRHPPSENDRSKQATRLHCVTVWLTFLPILM